MGAMWQPMTGPRGTISLIQKCSMCQNTIRPLVIPSQCHCTYNISELPRVIRPCHVNLCHVSPLQWCHVSPPESSTSAPTQSAPFHVICMTVRPVQSAATSALYGLYSQHCFCLFGETNRL
jgi:hypothetical protein